MDPWVRPVTTRSQKAWMTKSKFTLRSRARLKAVRPAAGVRSRPHHGSCWAAVGSALRDLLLRDDLAVLDHVGPDRHRRRVDLAVRLALELRGHALALVLVDEVVELGAGGVAGLDALEQDVGGVERLGAVGARVAAGRLLVVGREQALDLVRRHAGAGHDRALGGLLAGTADQAVVLDTVTADVHGLGAGGAQLLEERG